MKYLVSSNFTAADIDAGRFIKADDSIFQLERYDHVYVEWKDTDEWLGSRRSRMLDWRQPPSATPTIGDNIGDNLPPSHQHRTSIHTQIGHATTNTDNFLCSVLKRRVLCKLNFSYFLVD